MPSSSNGPIEDPAASILILRSGTDKTEARGQDALSSMQPGSQFATFANCALRLVVPSESFEPDGERKKPEAKTLGPRLKHSRETSKIKT